MSLQSAWVEAIHSRLFVRYGSAWTAKWQGLEPAAVRADWSSVLGGFDSDSIGYALNHLPDGWPPTATEFRELCRRAPRQEAPMLDWNRTPIPASVKAELAKIAGAQHARPPKQWAHDLQKREQNGERLTIAQRDMWRASLETDKQEPAAGWFAPIDPGLLPPEMRPKPVEDPRFAGAI